MSYRLKTIRYKTRPCHILLQNENGPCPLLAAANALLLRSAITLPSNCIGARFVTIDQLVNVLAERMLQNVTVRNKHAASTRDATRTATTTTTTNTTTTDFDQHNQHVQDVLQILPALQHGMDLNPKFTCGPTGVEYTNQLDAFDLLHVDLVHGWLLEPPPKTSPTDAFLNASSGGGGGGGANAATMASLQLEYDLIHNQTYNQLINQIIKGNEASAILEREVFSLPNNYTTTTNNNNNNNSSSTSAVDPPTTEPSLPSQTLTQLTLEQQQQYQDDMSKGTIIDSFLKRTSHQLTQYGLQTLYTHLNVGDVVVFFRNNHFSTLTKHTDGNLYLLVSDLGYANVETVVWEKLDVIDGDTEYVTSDFRPPPPYLHSDHNATAATGEQLLANSVQEQTDHLLALQLSREISGGGTGGGGGAGPPASTFNPGTTTATTAASNAGTTRPAPTPTVAMPSSSSSAKAAVGIPAAAAAPPPVVDEALEAAKQASLRDYELQLRNQPNMQGPKPPPPSALQTAQVASGGSPTTTVANLPTTSANSTPSPSILEEQDRMLALQLQQEQPSNYPYQQSHEEDHQYALKLQQEEDKERQRRALTARAPPPRQQPTAAPGARQGGGAAPTAAAAAASSKDSGCVIS